MTIAITLIAVMYAWLLSRYLKLDKSARQKSASLNSVIRALTSQNTKLRSRLQQYAVPFEDIDELEGPDPRFRPRR